MLWPWLFFGMVCVAAAAGLTTSSTLPLEGSGKEKFFMKSFSTVTFISVSTSTTVVPFTCFHTVDPPDPCEGRKLRKAKQLYHKFEDLADDTQLDSSSDMNLQPTDERDISQDGKLFFTLMRSATSTVTTTSTSINISITVSASAFCTFAGFTGPIC
ncbi:hypothetical protein Pmani_009374 [Petrolisthes manimaculis]|uniref:Uncharacterized protein n=1 Tax=Petrolisthes manimaculis TaxID=1843537 RepID=A0AAE1Q6K5_9EUCA|nr:hypothetical protein Pmani_009374 [Petrolisthes manimaculis]